MPKFIRVDETIINIEAIKEVKFISDDIYIDLFPRNSKGEIDIDYVPFTFAEIKLFDGKVIEMNMVLYQPEEHEAKDEWIKRNRSYINRGWVELLNTLEDITAVNGFEDTDY